MESRQQAPAEVTTRAFFDQPASTVAVNLARYVYSRASDGTVTYKQGKAKTIIVDTPEGQKEYRIEVAEPYSAATPNKAWRGVRAAEIEALEPGMIIVYPYRVGQLPFGVCHGADNVLIRELVDVATDRKIETPTAVTRVLGLTPDKQHNKGRLTFSGENKFRFEKIEASTR